MIPFALLWHSCFKLLCMHVLINRDPSSAFCHHARCDYGCLCDPHLADLHDCHWCFGSDLGLVHHDLGHQNDSVNHSSVLGNAWLEMTHAFFWMSLAWLIVFWLASCVSQATSHPSFWLENFSSRANDSNYASGLSCVLLKDFSACRGDLLHRGLGHVCHGRLGPVVNYALENCVLVISQASETHAPLASWAQMRHLPERRVQRQELEMPLETSLQHSWASSALLLGIQQLSLQALHLHLLLQPHRAPPCQPFPFCASWPSFSFSSSCQPSHLQPLPHHR